jgi:hypothetical protein
MDAPKPEMEISIGKPQARSIPEYDGEGTITHRPTHSPPELPSIVQPALFVQPAVPVQIVSIPNPAPIYIGRPLGIRAEPWNFPTKPNNRDTINRIVHEKA